MHALDTLSSVDHALVAMQQMNSAIEETAHSSVSPSELVDPLIPSIVHESGSEEKLHMYRTLGDMSIDAVFAVIEDDLRVSPYTGRNREGVIRDSITDRRLIAASVAARNFMRTRALIRIADAGRASS